MQRPISTAIFLLAQAVAIAATPVKSTIKEVTVYRSGAKISSVASVRLEAGKNEIVFENLSPFFNANSLQVKIAGGAVLNSAVFRINQPGPAPENFRVKIIRDSLVLLGDETLKISDDRNLLQAEADLIAKNAARIGTANPNNSTVLTTQEFIAFNEFYRKRNAEIKESLQKLVISERKLNENRQRLNRELERLQPIQPNRTGEIALNIEAESGRTVEITCNYLVSAAAWSPLYDLRTEGFGKPLQLVYKANVVNRTGFDWKSVTLHLSTAQPLTNNDRPILNPLFVDFRLVGVYAGKSKKEDYAISNLKSVESEEINIKGSRSNATKYLLDGTMVQGATVPVNDIEQLQALAEGLPIGNYDGNVVNFDLPKAQDILSDGKENILTIEKQEMAANYEYHAVPKLEPAVFLLAKIADYGKYNLLPGTANLFFAENFVGQAQINPLTTTDTLLLSLGRDEQIAIKRQQPKDFKEKTRFLNNSVKETSTFEIELKNNKSVAVTVNLLDQIPVSKQESIKVELEEKGGAKYSPELGKLEWNVEVPPGKSKKVRFTYTVEYPKGRAIF